MTMEENELDAILQVLENPIRRRIVKRLTRGSSYPLQLSKELGLGQPLVAKHLTLMEDAGIVTSSLEPGERGPGRRRYTLAKSISVTLDLAPNLFIQHGFKFASVKHGELPNETTTMMDEASKISGENRGDIQALSEVLSRVDQKLEELERQRAALLYVRNTAMNSASRAIDKMQGADMRKVVYSILEEHDWDVDRLSEELDLRESVVRSVLKELEDFFE
jgi:predicted transcriptional regulator